MEYTELISISNHELNLLKLIRSLGYGSIEVSVQDGQPVLAKNIIQSQKL